MIPLLIFFSKWRQLNNHEMKINFINVLKWITERWICCNKFLMRFVCNEWVLHQHKLHKQNQRERVSELNRHKKSFNLFNKWKYMKWNGFESFHFLCSKHRRKKISSMCTIHPSIVLYIITYLYVYSIKWNPFSFNSIFLLLLLIRAYVCACVYRRLAAFLSLLTHIHG